MQFHMLHLASMQKRTRSNSGKDLKLLSVAEDVVYLLDGLGIETGVELDKVVETGRWICGILGREPSSKAARALAAKRSAA